MSHEHQPVSLTRSVRLLTALVVLGTLATLLVVVLRDDLVRSWALGNAGAREIYEQGGLAALEADRPPPAFVPVALTLYVVLASLFWVLTVFLRSGHAWARLTLTGLLVFMGIAIVGALRTGPPVTFDVLAIAALLLELLLLVCLWHRDTGAYLRGSWSAQRQRA